LARASRRRSATSLPAS